MPLDQSRRASDGVMPMISFFYDVTHLESVEAIFDIFWEIWIPKCCRPLCEPPKRHILRVFWAIVRQNRSTGHFNGRVREKIIKKRPYVSRIWPDAPLWPIGTNFGLRVRLMDVINCANLYRNHLRGLDSLRVEYWPFPLDCDVTVNTVWTTVHTVIVNLLQQLFLTNLTQYYFSGAYEEEMAWEIGAEIVWHNSVSWFTDMLLVNLYFLCIDASSWYL